MEDERIAALLRTLRKGARDAATLSENFHPLLGGERYLTDREVIDLLKVSRRTLQEYRTTRKIPFILFGGKALYRESDIEKLLTENYRKAIP